MKNDILDEISNGLKGICDSASELDSAIRIEPAPCVTLARILLSVSELQNQLTNLASLAEGVKS